MLDIIEFQRYKIMKEFMFKKGRVGDSLSVLSSFKSFVVLVVMMIMTASSVMAEVIGEVMHRINKN